MSPPGTTCLTPNISEPFKFINNWKVVSKSKGYPALFNFLFDKYYLA